MKKIKNRRQLQSYLEALFRSEEEIDDQLAKLLELKAKEEFPTKNFALIEELIQANGAQHFLEITGGLLTHLNQKGEVFYEIFEPSETLAGGEVLSLEEKFLAGEGQNITPARFACKGISQEFVSEKVRFDLEKAAKKQNSKTAAKSNDPISATSCSHASFSPQHQQNNYRTTQINCK